MHKRKIVRNYTNSLFELAQDANLEDNLYEKLLIIVDIIFSSKKLCNFICSPLIQSCYKKKIIDVIVVKIKCPKLLIRFLHILIDNMRINFLQDVKLYYYNLLLESKGVKAVEVTFAKKCTVKQLDNIKKYLEKTLDSAVEISSSVDESLIAGMVIQYDSSLLDCSVAGMLQKIKKITIL